MLRYCVAVLAMLTAVETVEAQSMRLVSQTIELRGGESYAGSILCPPGYFPDVFQYSFDAHAPDYVFSKPVGEAGNLLGDSPSPDALLGGGYLFSLANAPGQVLLTVTISVYCIPDPPVSVQTVATQASVPAGGTGTASAVCPPAHVPLGMPFPSDSRTLVRRATSFLFGTPGNPIPLDVMPDGPTGAPIGMSIEVGNPTSGQQAVTATLICANFAGTGALIASTPTLAGKPFEVAAVVPDGNDLYGYAAAGGATATLDPIGIWGTDGSVSTHAPFFKSPSAGTGTHTVRGVFVSGRDTRNPATAKATSRAVVGLLLLPAIAPPPSPVVTTVVEFYNQALDHYFITAITKEISDLDAGVHVGWARTGRTFKAYATGSSGKVTRRPVCREYGNPAAGLDSHFYSASPSECLATLRSFNGDWLLEASEVFQMDLPDSTSGACPAGGAPIYRLWNTRRDSNHRYTTTIADRDAMVAKGYIAEGYGPNSVTLCALL